MSVMFLRRKYFSQRKLNRFRWGFGKIAEMVWKSIIGNYHRSDMSGSQRERAKMSLMCQLQFEFCFSIQY